MINANIYTDTHTHTKERNVDYKARPKGRAAHNQQQKIHCAHCAQTVRCTAIIKQEHSMYLLTLIKAGEKKCMF